MAITSIKFVREIDSILSNSNILCNLSDVDIKLFEALSSKVSFGGTISSKNKKNAVLLFKKYNIESQLTLS
jgi:hypothetical protein